MGAYENPQVFAPDYNVIQQSFQQGFNTTYQVMQQRKAKKEAQKNKRDAAEAAFYSGTSLPIVHGLDKKWNNIIGDYYRQSLGGFEGYDAMTKREQAELQADLGYMEGGMKGLSEAILKYQTGNVSSALDPKVLGLLDRIVYPKKDDPSGEWGYDIRLGESGVEFFYTEDGQTKSIPITDMSTWGQLLEDPTKHVDAIEKNINDIGKSKEHEIKSQATSVEDLMSNFDISEVLDLDANDVGTINYYNQYVDKDGDYHPSKEMMEQELDAIKAKGIEGIDDNDVITDEELEAYHAYQDQEITDFVTNKIRKQFEIYELEIKPTSTINKGTLHNTREEARAAATELAAFHNTVKEGESPNLLTHAPDFYYNDNLGKWVATTKSLTGGGSGSTEGGDPRSEAQKRDDIATAKRTGLQGELSGRMRTELDWLRGLIGVSKNYKSYSDYAKIFEEKATLGVAKGGIARDFDGNLVEDKEDIRKWIRDNYQGLQEGESEYTGKILEKYEYLKFLTNMGIKHTTGGERVLVDDVRPIKLENGKFVLRFDIKKGTAGDPQWEEVDIPFSDIQIDTIIAELTSDLDKTEDLQGKVNQLRSRRMNIMGGTDFVRNLGSDARIAHLKDFVGKHVGANTAHKKKQYKKVIDNILKYLNADEQEQAIKILEENKID